GTPEIVVVDNGSRDGSVARLRETVATVRVVEPEANLGYGAGVNRGVAVTTAPVVAVCNSDLVVSVGTGAAMLARLDAEPDLAAVAPAIHDPDGTPYPSARAFPSTPDAIGHALLGSIAPRNPSTRRYRQLDDDPGVARDVGWVSGAAV